MSLVTGAVTVLYSRFDEVGGGPAGSPPALARIVEDHGGDVIRGPEPGVMSAFESPVAALACASELRRELPGARTGLSAGLPADGDGDWVGSAGVVARRLCDRALPGHVLVSEQVERLIAPLDVPELRDAGPLSLEGVPDPVRAYELEESVETPAPGGPEIRQAAAALPPALAPEGTAFVGREREMAALLSVLEQARAGSRQVRFLAGEAGMGKTRTCRELAAAASGWTVLYGHAQQENVIPFQPFVEALRPHLPDWPPVDTGETDPETARFHLFESIRSLTMELARERPLLLVLDDLHWADAATTRLLGHLLAGADDAPLMVVATYRESELRGNEPLTDLLDVAAGEIVPLGGLDEDEMRQLIADWARREPAAGFARAVWQETGGNPFFAREVLRHLHGSGRLEVDAPLPGDVSLAQLGVPDEVRELIVQRVARLEEDTARVLQAAAVAGREFSTEVVRHVTGLAPEELRRALEEAAAARLVVEGAGHGRLAFAHVLFRDALYQGLSATSRVRIHLRIARALEEIATDGADPPLGELAEHYLASAVAAGPGRALEYARRAAERAMDQLAYEEAAGYHRRVLDTLALGPEDRCDALLGLGEASSRAGDTDRARRAFAEAAALARKIGCVERLETAAIGSARRFVEEPGVTDHDLIALLEQALDAGAGDSLTRVRLLGHLCGALYYTDARERIDTLSRDALAMADRLGDEEALAYASSARRRALWRPEHLDERIAAASAIVRHADATGNRELSLQGHGWLVVDSLEAGDLDAMDGHVSAFARGAEGLRQPLYEWNLGVWKAMRAILAGEFGRAEALAQEALAAGQRAESLTAPHYFAVQLFLLRREQGRLMELEPAAREFVARFPAIPSWRGALATIHAETGDADAARSELERMAAQDFADLPRDGNWLIGVTLAAEVCAVLGDSRRAELLYELLLPHERTLVVVALAAACYGPAARSLGILAAAAGRLDDAVRHLEDALARSRAIGSPPFVARTSADLAAVLLERDPGRARELASEAAAAARTLGMPALAERALRCGRAAAAPPRR